MNKIYRGRKAYRTSARGLGLLILLLILAGMTTPVLAYDANDAAASVVRVGGYDGKGNEGTGSAFVIAQDGGSTYLVTNRHVVMGHLYDPATGAVTGTYDFRDNLFIFMDDLNDVWLEDVTATILSNDLYDGMDLAILRVGTGLNNKAPLPLVSVETAKRGDKVNVLGFPGVSESFFSVPLPSTEEYVSIIPGSITNLSIETDGTKYIQHNALTAGGNSGGPVINEDGAVIGVHAFAMTQAEGFRGAVHIDYIIEQCERMGIQYTPYTPVADDTPETNSPAADTPTPPPAPTPTAPPDDNPSILDFWWVLLIVGAGIAILVAVLTKKPKAAIEPTPIPATAPADPQDKAAASAHLLCTKGHFAGTTFPVNGSLSIGRDPSRCQVVFPNDTKGISSLHCELVVQPSGLRLTDKGSSYGTFLMGGRKLVANESVTLKPGDGFYLADTNNEFKVL